MGARKIPLDDLFAVAHSPTKECVPWPGLKGPGGYGNVYDGRVRLAHRWVFEREHGPIPDRMVVMHTCDVRNCVNLRHLRLGTTSDNAFDMVRKGRHNPRRGEDAPHAVLTEAKVRAIRILAASRCMEQKDIAALFGIHKSMVSTIHCRRQWKRVTDSTFFFPAVA